MSERVNTELGTDGGLQESEVCASHPQRITINFKPSPASY